ALGVVILDQLRLRLAIDAGAEIRPEDELDIRALGGNKRRRTERCAGGSLEQRATIDPCHFPDSFWSPIRPSCVDVNVTPRLPWNGRPATMRAAWSYVVRMELKITKKEG